MIPLSNAELLASFGKKSQPPQPTQPLSPEAINELLKQDQQQQQRVPQSDVFYRHGFDKTFLFLLTMNYENLFEPWESGWYSFDGFWWKCKGCSRKVKRTGRESHYAWHKKELV